MSIVKFDEDYFEKGEETGVSCYTKYRWMPELSIPLAKKLKMLFPGKTILDFGCAKGYLVKALRLIGVDAYGCDISDYALSKAPTEIRKYVSKQLCYCDVIFAKDVFEHIPYNEIDALVKSLSKVCDEMLVIVPLSSRSDNKYNILAYEYDKTHIIREDLNWWKDIFRNNGFDVKTSTYNMAGYKDSWSGYKEGNARIFMKVRR